MSETTYFCHCSCFVENWDYNEDGEMIDVNGFLFEDDEPCTRRLIIRKDFVRLLEDHTGMKADCALPIGLCDALADIVRRNRDGTLPEGDTIYDCVWMDDDGGDRVVLSGGMVIVDGIDGEFSLDVADNIYVAFQEALVAHGAKFEYVEDDDDRDSHMNGNYLG